MHAFACLLACSLATSHPNRVLTHPFPSTRYPKHVWSPAGGWYAQPKNWRANTAIMLGVVVGITAMAWSVSAEREHRYKMPEVCLPNVDWEDYGGNAAGKIRADIVWNSLTGSHLRDTGRGRLGSTRLHRRPRLVARDPHRKQQRSEGPMWYYGVFGKQRDESGCGKDICTYAKKRIDKFHQSCSADGFDGMYIWVALMS